MERGNYPSELDPRKIDSTRGSVPLQKPDSDDFKTTVSFAAKNFVRYESASQSKDVPVRTANENSYASKAKVDPHLAATNDRRLTRSMARSKSPQKHSLTSEARSKPPVPCPPKKENPEKAAMPCPQKPKIPPKPKEPTLSILLLGEAGVGKTTFINGLANYLKFQSMDEALAGEATVAVDASFVITNKKNQAVVIRADATGEISAKKNEQLENKGESCTQVPVTHRLRWKENGKEKIVQIIDTPGMNDTRGPEQDETNFDKILRHISGVGELHAICILMKPNESKFTVAFRSCLDNLLVKLHKSATDNILFCFTNTRSTLYRPGDTLPTLDTYLRKIEKETGVIINANKNNILCFDNDCFRYLCVLRASPIDRTDSSFDTFSEGWLHNVQESVKLLMKVQGLTAHVVEDTVNITKTRNLITAMARPLAEIAKNHLVNKKLIEQRIQEIERLDKEGRSLSTCIKQKQAVIVPKKLDKPRTVCTAPSCCDYEKVNQFETRRIPKTICHDSCYLTGVQEQSVNNNALLSCMAFTNGKCTVCGCEWKLHMRTTYEFVKSMESVFDRDAYRQLGTCNDNKARAQLLLQQEKGKMDELVRELDHIRDCTAEFSVFLSTNSMKHSFDPYADYLDFLVKEEIDKTVEGGAKELLFELWNVQENYAKRVDHIKKEIASGKRNASSTAELKNMVDNLSKLKQCGAIIAKIKEFQASGGKTEDQSDGGQRLSDDLKDVQLGSNGRKRNGRR